MAALALISITCFWNNFNSGVFTRLKNDGCDSMMEVRCVAHRLELVVKEVLMAPGSCFRQIHDVYQTIWTLFRQSTKLKKLLKLVGETLHITCVTFPKISGTRFVAHKVASFVLTLPLSMKWRCHFDSCYACVLYLVSFIIYKWFIT